MHTTLLRWVIACFLIAVSLSSRSENSEALGIGIRRTLSSEVLGETRTIDIYLPPSYETSHSYHRYPVVYLRDGRKFFHSFTGAIAQLTSDATPHAPEMIVVAIHEVDRVRDSAPTHSLIGFTGKEDEGFATSGGGGKFLRFLQKELIPYVEREFSVSDYRIYMGYSFTGLSAIDALLAQDRSFDAFIIIDPSWWWDDYVMEKRARAALGSHKFDKVQLFLAASGETYPREYFIESRDIGALAELLRSASPSGIEWTLERYADESHHSMPLRAFYDGISYIFRGYRPTLQELYNEPEKLHARYEALSARLGEPFALREDVLSFFGYQFLRQFQEPDKAIDYFELATNWYPGSSAAWDGLAESHHLANDRARAIAAYERSLQVDPNNENAKRMLETLRAEPR